MNKDATPTVKTWLGILSPLAVFLVLCCAILPYAGLQADEALFTEPLCTRLAREFRIRPIHFDIPLMLLSYLGTAKTWLYGLLFQFWRPSIWSVRLPVVFIGALTLLVWSLLAFRIAGRRLAIILCLILATDASFILTTTFDWGPVAIQHLAYASALLFAISGFHRKSPLRFGIALFFIGLGMWDKALFIWMLSGAAIAVIVLFHRQVWSALTWRNLAAAVLGFVLGASPLIVYNILNPLKTFRGNAVFSTDNLFIKTVIAKRTLDGSAYFAYLVNDPGVPKSRLPRNALEHLSVAAAQTIGEHRSNLTAWALIASLAAVPLWWRNRKIVFFALISIAVAWPQMLFVKDTGGSAHHVVLLWPLPHLIIACAIAGLARFQPRFSTPAIALALLLICGANVLNVNQYVSQFITYGSAPIWTDAILPLSREVSHWPDRHMFITDWGIDQPLRMLTHGRDRLWDAAGVLLQDPSPENRAALTRILGLDPVFVTHTPAYEVITGLPRRLVERAESLGYHRHLLATIDDSNGRPVFEISEFLKPGTP